MIDAWQECEVTTIDFEEYLRSIDIPEEVVKLVTILYFKSMRFESLADHIVDIIGYSKEAVTEAQK
jgi:hypothetical protein